MSYERGTVIAGKYRVERVIGQGGMGVVLAARHLGLDEMVAVKLIREERAAGADALARFQREARAAARIKSEHVARVLDVDRLPEGEPYIVMELIDGTDLHALVKRRGTLPADEAVTFITQACEGLAEAHALGMVHRDLKLKNLFLTKRRDGRALIKVIDFGVVKLSPVADDTELTLASGSTSQLGRTKARDATLTGAAVLVGSVHYMAPEQIRASNIVDARADVWSLGVCLYAMLTGALPFEGDTIAAVCGAIQGRPAPDVRELAPSVPPGLAAAVNRALEKDVRRRFANVAQLAEALTPFGADHAAAARIETILQSASLGHDVPHGASSDAVDPHGSTVSSDSAPLFSRAPSALFKGRVESTIDGRVESTIDGRVESTIDAAAVGSLATYPAPSVPSKRRWVTGALVVLAAAAGTVVIWGRPAPTRTIRGDAPATATATTTVTTATATATSALAAAPPPSASSTSEPTPASMTTSSAPRTAPVKRPPATPRKAPTPATAAPKSEPSSAYDHF